MAVEVVGICDQFLDPQGSLSEFQSHAAQVSLNFSPDEFEIPRSLEKQTLLRWQAEQARLARSQRAARAWGLDGAEVKSWQLEVQQMKAGAVFRVGVFHMASVYLWFPFNQNHQKKWGTLTRNDFVLFLLVFS